jgi:hypothetical protein
MRPSSVLRPSNEFVISAVLDETTLMRLKELEKNSGMSRSKLIRTMIMATSTKAHTPSRVTHTSKTPTPKQK